MYSICDDKRRFDDLYKATSTSGPISHLPSEHKIKELKRKGGIYGEFERDGNIDTIYGNRGISI